MGMTIVMSPPLSAEKRALLSDPRLHRELLSMVRKRVPSSEADDVVQATLTEALASGTSPGTVEEMRRWIWGIARHKIVDLHRKHRRESPGELPEVEAPGEVGHEASDLLRWAERELPQGEGGKQTLGWLLREGEGEKLEHIAESESVPAPRVRQRVTRLRQHFRARWQAQLAAVATLVGAVALLWWWMRPRPAPEPPIAREAPREVDPSVERARELRRLALVECGDGVYAPCLEKLDEAAKLDPAGDQAPAVVEARKAAASATAPSASALPSISPTATASAAPSALPIPSGTPAKRPITKESTGSLDSLDSKPTPVPRSTATPSEKGYSGKKATKPFIDSDGFKK